MANVLTANFSHTYAGAEVTNELFYQPEENVPALADLYQFKGITGDKANIYLPQQLRKIYKKYTTCGFSATGGVTTIVDKVISVEKIKANLEECVDAWDDTVFAELMKTGVDRDDLSGTVIDEVIRTQFMKGAKSDLHRLIWFADINDADTDWDHFDGFITKMLDNSASIGADCFIDMDGTAFESTDTLASDGAIGLFRQMWTAQDATLRAVPSQQKKFYVTNTVIDNYATTLENQGNSEGQRLIQDGATKYFFRGVEIVPVPEWDVNLADSANPHYTGSGLSIGSNLIVYAVSQNLVFASDVRSGENEFKIRYADNDEETMKLTSKLKLGAEIIHYEYTCIAY